MPANQELVAITVKLPRKLLNALNEVVEKQYFSNRSNVVRDAIIEKIEREHPDLLKKGV